MNGKYKLFLAVLAGAALGGIAVQGLHAQAKPPVLAVVDISEVTDPVAWKAITQRPSGSTVTVQMGGRYIARTDHITALDGTPPHRFVIISFDSLAKAKAWYDSPDEMKVNSVRAKATKSRVFIVEGM